MDQFRIFTENNHFLPGIRSYIFREAKCDFISVDFPRLKVAFIYACWLATLCHCGDFGLLKRRLFFCLIVWMGCEFRFNLDSGKDVETFSDINKLDEGSKEVYDHKHSDPCIK